MIFYPYSSVLIGFARSTESSHDLLESDGLETGLRNIE